MSIPTIYKIMNMLSAKFYVNLYELKNVLNCTMYIRTIFKRVYVISHLIRSVSLVHRIKSSNYLDKDTG